ncbi:MAG: ribosome maturation factor RimM [Atopobiaceae bacterium]
MAVSVHGLPPLLHEGMRVVVVPPRLKGERIHTVKQVTETSQRTGQLIRLSGVSTLAEAEELRGRSLLCLRRDLPSDIELKDAVTMCGRSVRDMHAGLLGRVREVLQGPANDVWVVAADAGEYLIPVIDDISATLESEDTVSIDVDPQLLAGLFSPSDDVPKEGASREI